MPPKRSAEIQKKSSQHEEVKDLADLRQHLLNELGPSAHGSLKMPTLGWSSENAKNVLTYLQLLRTAAAYINWNIDTSSNSKVSRKYMIHPKPIRFIAPSTREQWAGRRWHHCGYSSMKEMEEIWDTIEDAVANYDESKVNFFVFYSNWPKSWQQTPLVRILDPPGRFDPVNGGEECIEMTEPEDLRVIEYHRLLQGVQEPNVFVLRIEGQEVKYFDPFYDEEHNPMMAEPGQLRRLSDVYFSNIAQQFLRRLRDTHKIYNIGEIGGGGEWGSFPGINTVERCMSLIRDEMWATIRGEPIQPHEQVYHDVGEWRQIFL